MAELSLTVRREIAAPIEQVYKAWLDPVLLAKFMIPCAGMSVPEATADAREGGRFEVIMADGDKQTPHGGEYKILNPFTQIVFSWESPFSIDGSTVTLNLSEINDKTLVELVHVKFPDQQSCDNHNAGWSSILHLLDTTIS